MLDSLKISPISNQKIECKIHSLTDKNIKKQHKIRKDQTSTVTIKFMCQTSLQYYSEYYPDMMRRIKKYRYPAGIKISYFDNYKAFHLHAQTYLLFKQKYESILAFNQVKTYQLSNINKQVFFLLLFFNEFVVPSL